MKKLIFFFAVWLSLSLSPPAAQKIFDVHLHGSENISAQISQLQKAGVYKVAVSSSWESQELYRSQKGIAVLYGLMFPCPNGKVPYSLQPCFGDGGDWPSPAWVEAGIREGKINFLGEVLSQYYGISSSDSSLRPYYALAEKYEIPVGIHTGGAGPDHGSPNFQMDLGDPLLLENAISSFPKLKFWLMHSGDQYFQHAMQIMEKYPQVYADISVISNPDIVSPERFVSIMQEMIGAGLEDRLMFGTDNGDVFRVVEAVRSLNFLSELQKQKIFYQNAERFFGLRR